MLNVLHEIAKNNKLQLQNIQYLQGGDINQVYLLKGKSKSVVVKLNHATKYPQMFKAEVKGLEHLKNSNTFKIPEVIQGGELDGFSYLLLEYIKEGSTNNWTLFAQQLAKLHQNTSTVFGLDHTNYIGSLMQYNHNESTASNFYIQQRLIPQFELASKQGYNFLNLDIFYKNITSTIPEEIPSLIHGDLWNGNCFFSAKKEAVLIDPAIAFAPREMEFAMMQLFGGFPKEVYNTYLEIFPLQDNWEDRIPIWQLYYLLVHLNLFGSHYLQQVNNIVNRYY